MRFPGCIPVPVTRRRPHGRQGRPPAVVSGSGSQVPSRCVLTGGGSGRLSSAGSCERLNCAGPISAVFPALSPQDATLALSVWSPCLFFPLIKNNLRVNADTKQHAGLASHCPVSWAFPKMGRALVSLVPICGSRDPVLPVLRMLSPGSSTVR